MEPKIIKTKAQYKAAMSRIETLMSAKPGTPEGDALELWCLLVEDYEQRTFPILFHDPVSAIRFRMEQAGLTEADLVPYIGSRNKVAEVLNGRRTLNLAMIRGLHEGLGIPAEVLLQQPQARLSA